MRTKVFAVLAFTALSGGSLIGLASPAAAADPYDYPWCIQGRQTGYPGYCGFQTYQQCQATASGQDAYCGYNPRFAFGQQRLPSHAIR